MTKVYVVTTGSYSDYGIDSMFSTREGAERHHNMLNETGVDVNDIAEYDLDSVDPNIVAREVKGVAEIWSMDMPVLKIRKYMTRMRSPGYDEIEIRPALKAGVVYSVLEGSDYAKHMNSYRKQQADVNDRMKIVGVHSDGRVYNVTYVYSFISQEHANKVCAEVWQRHQAVTASRK